MEPNYTLHQNFNEDDAIDFKHYFGLLISNWYWFAFALFVSISIAYGINRWSEKVYTVNSTLLIKDDKLGGGYNSLTEIFPGAEAFKSQQNLKNEIGILKSFSLNYRVMQELDEFHVVYVKVGKRGIVESRQYKDCPFVVRYDTIDDQILDKLVVIKILSNTTFLLEIDGDDESGKTFSFGKGFKNNGFNFIIEKRSKDEVIFDTNGSNKYFFYFINPFTLANQYRARLSIVPVEEEASLMSLSSTGFVPKQEADYLNKLMEVYIKQGLEFKNLTAEKTIEFIDQQLGLISDSLTLAEDRLEKFRLVNNLVNISREGTIIQDKFESIEKERTLLLLQKSYYEYLEEYINSKQESKDIVAPSIMGVTDQLLIQLVGELAVFQQQKKQLGMNLQEFSEPLRIIESNIQNTKQAISENISSASININRSLGDVNIGLERVEADIKKLPSTERQMINIQRKFDINNTVYTFLLEKRAEAGIAKASNVPDNRIIDYANSNITSRIKPKSQQNLMLAFVLGLLIPMIGIIVLDYLNNSIMDKKDIEKGTSAPIIGFIGHNDFNSELPVVERPGSTLAESFRSVRTNLKYFAKEITCPVISVSSTISSEGKTFISANLAAILASLNKKVLLVGLDLRKPRTHKILGIENTIGMSTYLIGQNSFDEVVTETNIVNLWYASSGAVPPNPAELIESQAMKDFISIAKTKFDYIIIDTPPVAIVTDALLVSPITDFYLFVVRQRYTSKNMLGLIEELHKNENIKSMGIVFNDISLSGYYRYGLRYGYSLGYGYSYGYNYYGQNFYSGYKNSEYGKEYYNE